MFACILACPIVLCAVEMLLPAEPFCHFALKTIFLQISMEISDANSEPVKPLFYEINFLAHFQLQSSTWAVMQNICAARKIAIVSMSESRQKEKGKNKERHKE